MKKDVAQKVVVLGNFGQGVALSDGQTILTRIVYDEMKRFCGERDVIYVNTGEILGEPIRILWRLMCAVRASENVIIMPGRRGLRVLMPLYSLLCRAYGRRLHYVVVGGWLPGFLKKKPLLKFMVNICEGVYVESSRMKKELNNIGIKKVYVRPNMRRFDICRSRSDGVGRPLRLVFLSRVIREKGVGIAINAVRKLNEKEAEDVVELDVWGPLKKEDEGWFRKSVAMGGAGINYRGVLAQEEIYPVLSQYDAMVFPTYYDGEGCPGVVIDAYVAGLPVLASDWHDNREYVEERVTGMIFGDRDEEGLIAKIREVLNDPELLRAMKRNAADKAEAYHVDTVMPRMLAQMGLGPRDE